LAKHSSETSTGADLLKRQTSLPTKHGGGTRSRPVRAPRRQLRFDGRVGRARVSGQITAFLIRRETVCARHSLKQKVPACWKCRPMETYPVDLDPEQIVRWLMVEQQAAPSTFRITARRTTEVRDVPARRELHMGDEEREDLSEIATIATLEIAPIHASDGWLLTVAVEDEAGPPVAEGEEKIDLATFYSKFIRPGRGISNVVAEVENAQAKARMTRLLHAIDRNRHVPDGRQVKRRSN